jgi:hypothetical protein
MGTETMIFHFEREKIRNVVQIAQRMKQWKKKVVDLAN